MKKGSELQLAYIDIANLTIDGKDKVVAEMRAFVVNFAKKSGYLLKKYEGTYEGRQVASVLRGLTFAFLTYLKEKNAGILNDVAEYLDFNISKLSPTRLAEDYQALVNLKNALNVGEHSVFNSFINTENNNELATLTRHKQLLRGQLPSINTNKNLLASMMLRKSQMPPVETSMLIYNGEQHTYSVTDFQLNEKGNAQRQPGQHVNASLLGALNHWMLKARTFNRSQVDINKSAILPEENESSENADQNLSIIADKLESLNPDLSLLDDSKKENEQSNPLLFIPVDRLGSLNLNEPLFNDSEKENGQTDPQRSIFASELEDLNFDDPYYSDSEEENEQDNCLLLEPEIQKEPEQLLKEFTALFIKDYNNGWTGSWYGYLPGGMQTGIYNRLLKKEMTWGEVVAHGTAPGNENKRTANILRRMGVLPLENAVSSQFVCLNPNTALKF